MAEITQAHRRTRRRPRRRSRPPELNIFFGLIAIALIFEVLGWLLQGQSFLFNTQRLSIMILQVTSSASSPSA